MFSTPRLVLNVKSQQQQQQQQITLTASQHRDALNGLQYQNALNASQFPPNIQHPQTIQIPMLSALQVPQPQPNPQTNGPPPQQQQQQQQNALGQQGQGIPPPPPQNGQDYTLSSVLHFLQTEWRCYERDRNEWEIARAEMRVSDLALCFLYSWPCRTTGTVGLVLATFMLLRSYYVVIGSHCPP